MFIAVEKGSFREVWCMFPGRVGKPIWSGSRIRLRVQNIAEKLKTNVILDFWERSSMHQDSINALLADRFCAKPICPERVDKVGCLVLVEGRDAVQGNASEALSGLIVLQNFISALKKVPIVNRDVVDGAIDGITVSMGSGVLFAEGAN